MATTHHPARWFLLIVAVWAVTIAAWGPIAQWVPGWVRAVFAVPVAAVCITAAAIGTKRWVLAGLAVAAGFGAWNIIRITISDQAPRTIIAGAAVSGVATVAALVIGAYVEAGDDE